MEVADDIRMSEGGQDLELGMQLFSLLLGHLQVADLFSTQDHPVHLSLDLPNNAEGAMTYRDAQVD